MDSQTWMDMDSQTWMDFRWRTVGAEEKGKDLKCALESVRKSTDKNWQVT